MTCCFRVQTLFSQNNSFIAMEYAFGIDDEIIYVLDKCKKLLAELKMQRYKFLKASVLFKSLYGMIACSCQISCGLNEISITQFHNENLVIGMVCLMTGYPVMSQRLGDNIPHELKVVSSNVSQKGLKELCQSLNEIYGHPFVVAVKCHTVFEIEAVKIGNVFESGINKIWLGKNEICILKDQEWSSLLLCINELEIVALSLKVILLKLKTGLMSNLTEKKLQNYVSICESIGAKAISLRCSLKREIYHKHSVIALNGIYERLVTCKEEKKLDIDSVLNSVTDFHVLGDRFNSIADEYNKVLTNISKQIWTVEQLAEE